MRYFIEISYDGSTYHGWQRQPESPSIQSELEKALHFKAGLQGSVTGCGRTDSGVHARQFFAHFDLEQAFCCEALQEITRQANNFLPEAIAVKRIFSVQPGAHARFDASDRLYKYYISNTRNPFSRNFSWNLSISLDQQKMNEAASALFDYSDFTSFAKLHGGAKTNICRIIEAEWSEEQGMLVFSVRADRFLRNMVRSLVGTLVDVGRGKLSAADFRKIIESKDRCNAGTSVPAHGLFLEEINYNWSQIIPGH